MPLQPSRLIVESVPVAAILLLWHLLAGVARVQHVGGPVADAGAVMAALYVVVRGASLSDRADPPSTIDVRVVLAENARLAVPAGAWFLGAMAVGAIETYVHVFEWIVTAVASALAGAGLGVVGIYAVAAGYATFQRDGATTGVPTDD